jgi:hypothetical protein
MLVLARSNFPGLCEEEFGIAVRNVFDKVGVSCNVTHDEFWASWTG